MCTGGEQEEAEGRNVFYHSFSHPIGLTTCFLSHHLKIKPIFFSPSTSLFVGKRYQTNTRHFKLNTIFARKTQKVIKRVISEHKHN